MNKKEKLIKCFRTLPKDFTFEEVEALFGCCGFLLENKGATSGSRVKFYNENVRIRISCTSTIRVTSSKAHDARYLELD